MADGGDALVLIKPQFELQPEDIGPGGIVRDPDLHRRAVDKIHTFVTEELGRQWMGIADSPITGMEGNRNSSPGSNSSARRAKRGIRPDAEPSAHAFLLITGSNQLQYPRAHAIFQSSS